MPVAISVEQTIATRVSKQANGCWLWTGRIDSGGYGAVDREGREWRAHRYIYERTVGPVPVGLQLDHLCRVRHCVNPNHLEPVTPRENTMRSQSFAATHAAKTHCLHGHPYDEANTYVRRSAEGAFRGRGCRACNRAAQIRSQARRRVA